MRARQERVVFATCEDEDTLREEVESLLGEDLLVYSAEGQPHSRNDPMSQHLCTAELSKL